MRVTKPLLSLLPLLLLLAPVAQAAKTVYVSDQLEVPLYDIQGDASEVIRHVAVGDPLEVIKRDGELLQVRAPGGELGWIAAELVIGETPPRMRLLAMEAERAELRAKLRAAEGKLVAAGVTGVVDNPVPAMEEELITLRAENAKLRGRIDSAAAALSGSVLPSFSESADWREWAPWSGGILLLGFLFGFLYHRFRHCRSHGGFRITLG